MKHKLFTLFLALLTSSGTIFATSVTVDGIHYDLYVDSPDWSPYYHATVKGTTEGGDLVIQSSVSYSGHSYIVNAIWHEAFFNKKEITSMVIPSSVENIYDRAFAGCTGITSLDIPSSVTYIGSSAFAGVPNIHFTGTAKSQDESPWGAKYLNKYVEGKFVFNDATKTELLRCATSVSGDMYIPSSVKIIGEGAFYDCYQLTSIHIPGSVTKIGADAFLGCSNTIVYTNTPFVQCGEYAFGLDNSMTVLPDVDYKTDTNFVLCRRYDPVPFFTVIEEGSFVDTAFTETGDYTFTSIANTPATVHVVNGGCFIQLPDTTVCYGEWVSLSGTYQYKYVDEFEPSQWSSFYNEFPSEEFISEFMYYGSQTDYYQWFAFQYFWENYTANHGECDEQTRQGFETWYKSHFHEYASSCPDGAECMKVSSDGEKFYTSGSLTRTYINRQGCDSVVSRNVIVSKTVVPKIVPTPEQDRLNSGTLRFYDNYCIDETYVGYDNCEERGYYDACNPYDYTYAHAYYDYFMLNGVRYDIQHSTEGIYNDMYSYKVFKDQGILDEPSHIIDNLHAGYYHLVFYTDCDSVVEDIFIDRYGIEINGVYYKLQDASSLSYYGTTYDIPAEATVTYRGSSSTEYNEYSGDIVIPESVEVDGQVYQVKNIGEEAFYGCENITSITLLGNEVKLSLDCIYPNPGSSGYYLAYSGIVYGYVDNHWSIYTAYETVPIYVPFGSLKYYKERYTTDYTTDIKLGVMNFHVINPKNTIIEAGSTSATITFGNADEQKHIKACGVVEGQEFGGNIVEYSGLEPNSTYADVPFYVKTIEGDSDVIVCSFTTSALELTTKTSRPVSATTAILLAETNMADAETNCGFEWKRNDAPADMAGTKVYCPVASGQMAGRLKNLKDDVYYKYRAFYESAIGNMYYGDWQYIFTGDNAVEFDPVLYTYSASAVTEHEATLKGYALEGADDFTEQGFEYWAESRVLPNKKPGIRYKTQLGEKQTVTATGISMKVTLTDLDQGTVYKYRTFAKLGGETFYGSEMSFTTQGEWFAYVVTFLDKDGNIISTQQIEPGEDAVAPEAPEVEGFVFDGWDTDFTDVQSDLVVTAQYVEDTGEETESYTLKVIVEPAGCGLVLFDGKTIKAYSKTVEKGETITLTAVPEEGYEFVYYLDGNKQITDAEYEVTMNKDKTITAYFEEIQEAIDQITNDKSQTTNKIIKDNHIFILRGGKRYSMLGQIIE